jgi:aryl-alcohol dehydrogenase-like predicted oxidoreductase
MELRRLGTTDLKIAPLVLGGNVFGWTADRETTFTLLDAFLDAGFNAIDTADVYNRYVPGNSGGESEKFIGEWIKERGVRDRVVIITKGGLSMGKGQKGLGREYLSQACEASLERLQTDYIDVYMSHLADDTVPIEETLETHQQLIDAGKVRYSACSNYTVEQLTAALAAAGPGRARYAVFEPGYNLVSREYEDVFEEICTRENIGVIPFYGLASGFLTGKYRSKDDLAGKPRERLTDEYLTDRNFAILDRVRAVAARHDATPAQISLAWLMARPSITAPIASATNPAQLADILKSVEVKLTAEDFAELDSVA